MGSCCKHFSINKRFLLICDQQPTLSRATGIEQPHCYNNALYINLFEATNNGATTHPQSHPHPQILNENGIEDGTSPRF